MNRFLISDIAKNILDNKKNYLDTINKNIKLLFPIVNNQIVDENLLSFSARYILGNKRANNQSWLERDFSEEHLQIIISNTLLKRFGSYLFWLKRINPAFDDDEFFNILFSNKNELDIKYTNNEDNSGNSINSEFLTDQSYNPENNENDIFAGYETNRNKLDTDTSKSNYGTNNTIKKIGGVALDNMAGLKYLDDNFLNNGIRVFEGIIDDLSYIGENLEYEGMPDIFSWY